MLSGRPRSTPSTELSLLCLVVYVLAALWGIADAIWQTQINALYGSVFANNEEAAFSNYKLWESAGFLFSFLSQDSLGNILRDKF